MIVPGGAVKPLLLALPTISGRQGFIPRSKRMRCCASGTAGIE